MAKDRTPDTGIYQIAARPWTHPILYSLADYDRDAAEWAALSAYLEAN